MEPSAVVAAPPPNSSNGHQQHPATIPPKEIDCSDIFCLLQDEDFTTLRETLRGDGLERDDFIDTMYKLLSRENSLLNVMVPAPPKRGTIKRNGAGDILSSVTSPSAVSSAITSPRWRIGLPGEVTPVPEMPSNEPQLMVAPSITAIPQNKLTPLQLTYYNAVVTMFNLIDVNNNGDVSWDEFSHFMMNTLEQAAEVNATEAVPIPRSLADPREIPTYLKFNHLGQTHLRANRVVSTRMLYIPSWNKYALLERVQDDSHSFHGNAAAVGGLGGNDLVGGGGGGGGGGGPSGGKGNKKGQGEGLSISDAVAGGHSNSNGANPIYGARDDVPHMGERSRITLLRPLSRAIALPSLLDDANNTNNKTSGKFGGVKRGPMGAFGSGGSAGSSQQQHSVTPQAEFASEYVIETMAFVNTSANGGVGSSGSLVSNRIQQQLQRQQGGGGGNSNTNGDDDDDDDYIKRSMQRSNEAKNAAGKSGRGGGDDGEDGGGGGGGARGARNGGSGGRFLCCTTRDGKLLYLNAAEDPLREERGQLAPMQIIAQQYLEFEGVNPPAFVATTMGSGNAGGGGGGNSQDKSTTQSNFNVTTNSGYSPSSAISGAAGGSRGDGFSSHQNYRKLGRCTTLKWDADYPSYLFFGGMNGVLSLIDTTNFHFKTVPTVVAEFGVPSSAMAGGINNSAFSTNNTTTTSSAASRLWGGSIGGISPAAAAEAARIFDNTSAIIEMCILPERGTKRVITSHANGKLRLFDITAQLDVGDFLGATSQSPVDLIKNAFNPIHCMTYHSYYSLMISLGMGDTEPILWSPFAASNRMIKRLVDPSDVHRPSALRTLVHAEALPNSPYVITSDVGGVLKVWDLRNMSVSVTQMADGRPAPPGVLIGSGIPTAAAGGGGGRSAFGTAVAGGLGMSAGDAEAVSEEERLTYLTTLRCRAFVTEPARGDVITYCRTLDVSQYTTGGFTNGNAAAGGDNKDDPTADETAGKIKNANSAADDDEEDAEEKKRIAILNRRKNNAGGGNEKTTGGHALHCFRCTTAPLSNPLTTHDDEMLDSSGGDGGPVTFFDGSEPKRFVTVSRSNLKFWDSNTRELDSTTMLQVGLVGSGGMSANGGGGGPDDDDKSALAPLAHLMPKKQGVTSVIAAAREASQQKKKQKGSSGEVASEYVTCFAVEDNQYRFFIGTSIGRVLMYSTTTQSVLAECRRHMTRKYVANGGGSGSNGADDKKKHSKRQKANDGDITTPSKVKSKLYDSVITTPSRQQQGAQHTRPVNKNSGASGAKYAPNTNHGSGTDDDDSSRGDSDDDSDEDSDSDDDDKSNNKKKKKAGGADGSDTHQVEGCAVRCITLTSSCVLTLGADGIIQVSFIEGDSPIFVTRIMATPINGRLNNISCMSKSIEQKLIALGTSAGTLEFRDLTFMIKVTLDMLRQKGGAACVDIISLMEGGRMVPAVGGGGASRATRHGGTTRNSPTMASKALSTKTTHHHHHTNTTITSDNGRSPSDHLAATTAMPSSALNKTASPSSTTPSRHHPNTRSQQPSVTPTPKKRTLVADAFLDPIARSRHLAKGGGGAHHCSSHHNHHLHSGSNASETVGELEDSTSAPPFGGGVVGVMGAAKTIIGGDAFSPDASLIASPLLSGRKPNNGTSAATSGVAGGGNAVKGIGFNNAGLPPRSGLGNNINSSAPTITGAPFQPQHHHRVSTGGSAVPSATLVTCNTAEFHNDGNDDGGLAALLENNGITAPQLNQNNQGTAPGTPASPPLTSRVVSRAPSKARVAASEPMYEVAPTPKKVPNTTTNHCNDDDTADAATKRVSILPPPADPLDALLYSETSEVTSVALHHSHPVCAAGDDRGYVHTVVIADRTSTTAAVVKAATSASVRPSVSGASTSFSPPPAATAMTKQQQAPSSSLHPPPSSSSPHDPFAPQPLNTVKFKLPSKSSSAHVPAIATCLTWASSGLLLVGDDQGVVSVYDVGFKADLNGGGGANATSTSQQAALRRSHGGSSTSLYGPDNNAVNSRYTFHTTPRQLFTFNNTSISNGSELSRLPIKALILVDEHSTHVVRNGGLGNHNTLHRRASTRKMMNGSALGLLKDGSFMKGGPTDAGSGATAPTTTLRRRTTATRDEETAETVKDPNDLFSTVKSASPPQTPPLTGANAVLRSAPIRSSRQASNAPSPSAQHISPGMPPRAPSNTTSPNLGAPPAAAAAAAQSPNAAAGAFSGPGQSTVSLSPQTSPTAKSLFAQPTNGMLSNMNITNVSHTDDGCSNADGDQHEQQNGMLDGSNDADNILQTCEGMILLVSQGTHVSFWAEDVAEDGDPYDADPQHHRVTKAVKSYYTPKIVSVDSPRGANPNGFNTAAPRRTSLSYQQQQAQRKQQQLPQHIPATSTLPKKSPLYQQHFTADTNIALPMGEEAQLAFSLRGHLLQGKGTSFGPIVKAYERNAQQSESEEDDD